MCLIQDFHWSGFNRSKFKDGEALGDDVSVIVPGNYAAIFDGATGQQSAGHLSGGRVAANVAAQALLGFTNSDLMSIDSNFIMNKFSHAVGMAATSYGFERPISTTASLVICDQKKLRVIILGDSGVRINGEKTYSQDMLVDEISIPARVAFFPTALDQTGSADNAETLARKVSMIGLDASLSEGIIDPNIASKLIEAAVKAVNGKVPSDMVEDFLLRGIVEQQRFANRADHLLGYGVLNGAAEVLPPLELFFPLDDIQTVEIFSDGYQICPDEVSSLAWEKAYSELEKADHHRISAAPAVKGSTSTMWHDDRSVILLETIRSD